MNTGIQKYVKLLQKKHRAAEKKFIVEGVRICREALISDWPVEIAFVTEYFSRSTAWDEFNQYFRQKRIPFKVLKDSDFKKLSDTQTPQGVLLIMQFRPEPQRQINLKKARFVLAVESVRDPGNLGTIIRTAEWFGADALYLSDDCVDPFNPKVIRSTMGAIFQIPVLAVPDLYALIRELKANHFYIVVSTVRGDKLLHQAHFRKPVALILGGEAQGVSASVEKSANLSVRIWKFGTSESLNVAVAGGILMNHIAVELFLKRKREPAHGK